MIDDIAFKYESNWSNVKLSLCTLPGMLLIVFVFTSTFKF